MARKHKTPWEKFQSLGEAGDVRTRDVYGEQQFGRSKLGDKKTMTSRVILITILVLLFGAFIWFLFSMAQFGLFYVHDATSSSGPPVAEFTAAAPEASHGAGPRRLGAYIKLSATEVPTGAVGDPDGTVAAPDGTAGVQADVDAGAGDAVDSGGAGAPVQAGGSAAEFWDMAAYEGHPGMAYKDFLNKFFGPAPDGSTKYVGRFNGKIYSKLDIFDVWGDVTEKMHWPGYCSLYDSSIESAMSYQSLDPDDGRPAYDANAGTSQGSTENPGQAVNPADPNAGANPGTNPVEDPNAPQGSVIDPSVNPGSTVTPGDGSGDVSGDMPGSVSGDADVQLPEGPDVDSNIDSNDGAKSKGDPSTIQYWLLDFSSWKVMWTLAVMIAVWCVAYMFAKKNLDAQNQLEDTEGLNQYTNDQHIQLPEEVMRTYDWFPDVGAHCPVQVSSMLSHVMLAKKGIKNVTVCKRADKDIIGDDGEPEYLKGEILMGADGKPITMSVPLIDEDFADKLFDSAFIPDTRQTRKYVRLRYTTDDIPYNPENRNRLRQRDADTVADMINKYWTLPSYEPQRPAGAYLVDTEPSNTMV